MRIDALGIRDEVGIRPQGRGIEERQRTELVWELIGRWHPSAVDQEWEQWLAPFQGFEELHSHDIVRLVKSARIESRTDQHDDRVDSPELGAHDLAEVGGEGNRCQVEEHVGVAERLRETITKSAGEVDAVGASVRDEHRGRHPTILAPSLHTGDDGAGYRAPRERVRRRSCGALQRCGRVRSRHFEP